MGNMQGISRHNERQNKTYSNKDINTDKSHLNYHLKKPVEKSYEKEFYRLRKENNLKGNLRLTGKKQSNVACEFLITSDSDYFKQIGPERTKEYFKTSYEFACEKVGEKNILSAVVHMDETTPHMHLTYIPTVKALSKGQEVEKINCSEFWKGFNSYGVLQDNFHQYVNEHGFKLDRGEKNEDREEKREHLEMQDYKVKTLSDKARELEKETNNLKKDLNALNNDLSKVDGIKLLFDKINAIEGKYGLLSKNKVTLGIDEFEVLKDSAKKNIVLESKIKKLEQDNLSMQKEIKEFNQYEIKNNNKIYSFHQKLGEANKTISNLKSELSLVRNFLEKNGELENARDHIKQQKLLKKEKDLSPELE